MTRNLLPLLLIAVSVALFYLHIDPRYQDVKALSDEKSQYVQALTKAGELKNVATELLGKYNNISQDNLLKLEKLVPDTLNTVKLVADINAIAGKYGIALEGIRVTEKTSDSAQQVETGENSPKYNTATVSFSFSATYENLTLFLTDLEKSLQIVDIKSVDFDSDVENTNASYDYSVSFQTYWLK